MKKYIKPLIHIIELDNNNLLYCSCGCMNNPDGSHKGGGCWGCPHCHNHNNQGNHECASKEDYFDDDWDSDY